MANSLCAQRARTEHLSFFVVCTQPDRSKAQELRPGLELATSGDRISQEAKEAEKLERRKLYPVPPDAAANFRPAVGKELVEHAMQVSAAKRAELARTGQGSGPGKKEAKAAGGQQFERTTLAGQEGGSSLEVRSNATNQPVAQEGRTSNPTTSLQLGSSRETLRSPHAETHSKAVEKPAERRSPAPAVEKAADSAVEAQSSTHSQAKPLRRVDPVIEEQIGDRHALDEAKAQSAVPASTAAAGELSQAVAEENGSQQSGERRQNSSDASETSAVPTPEQRRDTALKVSHTLLVCRLRRCTVLQC